MNQFSAQRLEDFGVTAAGSEKLGKLLALGLK
jgi:hypothetical protein